MAKQGRGEMSAWKVRIILAETETAAVTLFNRFLETNGNQNSDYIKASKSDTAVLMKQNFEGLP